MNTAFNPGLIDVTNLSSRAVQRLGHADDIDHQPRQHPMAARLRVAAAAFDRRLAAQPNNTFLPGKAATCLDMAAKLDRFGSFVSDRQHDFALKLIEWSGAEAQQGRFSAAGAPVAAPVAPTPAPRPVVRLERLFGLMQGLSKLRFGKLTIARKNGDSLCWVKHEGCDKVVGKIEGGVLTQWARPGVDMAEVQVMLKVIDLDPKAAAAAHGLESGNCSVCGRDLTDPESISIGIGPICLEKFGA